MIYSQILLNENGKFECFFIRLFWVKTNKSGTKNLPVNSILFGNGDDDGIGDTDDEDDDGVNVGDDVVIAVVVDGVLDKLNLDENIDGDERSNIDGDGRNDAGELDEC